MSTSNDAASTPAPATLARAEGLTFAYPGGPDLFHGLDLEIRGGEILGLLGPNGAGKSTLLSLCCGLLTPTRGQITLGGEAIGALSRRAIARRVALVPQDVAAPFPFTVLEMVLLGRTARQGLFGLASTEDLEAAESALEATGLMALRGRRLDTLSGGERQRVLLARALAQDTPLLACDEVTAHLDIRHQVRTYDLLFERTRSPGHGAVCVLHDLNLAAAYCDRLLLLDAEGRPAALGSVDEVLTYARLTEVYRTEIWVGINELTGALTLAPVGRRRRHRPESRSDPVG